MHTKWVLLQYAHIYVLFILCSYLFWSLPFPILPFLPSSTVLLCFQWQFSDITDVQASLPPLLLKEFLCKESRYKGFYFSILKIHSSVLWFAQFLINLLQFLFCPLSTKNLPPPIIFFILVFSYMNLTCLDRCILFCFFFKSIWFIYLCVYMHVYKQRGMSVEVRGQLVEATFLLSPCWSKGLKLKA